MFLWGHRSISLSTAGRKLAPRLTALFAEMERLVSDVADLGAQQLQVSSMPSFASRWIAPRLGSFLSANPAIQVRIAGGDARSDFDRDGVDVGLRYGDGDYPGLHRELLFRSVASPVCSPALANDWPDPAVIPAALLLEDKSSLVAPGLPTWRGWFTACGVDRRDNGAAWFGNSHMALAAAAAGQGFALGISPLVDDDLAAGRLVQPYRTALDSSFGFWFVCRQDRVAEPKIAAFRAWLLNLSTTRGARA